MVTRAIRNLEGEPPRRSRRPDVVAAGGMRRTAAWRARPVVLLLARRGRSSARSGRGAPLPSSPRRGAPTPAAPTHGHPGPRRCAPAAARRSQAPVPSPPVRPSRPRSAAALPGPGSPAVPARPRRRARPRPAHSRATRAPSVAAPRRASSRGAAPSRRCRARRTQALGVVLRSGASDAIPAPLAVADEPGRPSRPHRRLGPLPARGHRAARDDPDGAACHRPARHRGGP